MKTNTLKKSSSSTIVRGASARSGSKIVDDTASTTKKAPPTKMITNTNMLKKSSGSTIIGDTLASSIEVPSIKPQTAFQCTPKKIRRALLTKISNNTEKLSEFYMEIFFKLRENGSSRAVVRQFVW